jgi:hypothetical protein
MPSLNRGKCLIAKYENNNNHYCLNKTKSTEKHFIHVVPTCHSSALISAESDQSIATLSFHPQWIRCGMY